LESLSRTTRTSVKLSGNSTKNQDGNLPLQVPARWPNELRRWKMLNIKQLSEEEQDKWRRWDRRI